MPVIALLYMDEGSNSLIPDMGLRDTVIQFPFSDQTEADALISKMNNEFSRWLDVQVTASIEDASSDWNSGEITLRVDIMGVPAPLKVSVNRDNSSAKTFKIIPPSSFR